MPAAKKQIKEDIAETGTTTTKKAKTQKAAQVPAENSEETQQVKDKEAEKQDEEIRGASGVCHLTEELPVHLL